MATQQGQQVQELPSRDDFRRIIGSIPAILICLGLLLFLPAGTIYWQRGWLFVAMFVGWIALSSLVLWRVNPAIFVARSRFHAGTKSWDKRLLPFMLAFMLAILPLAALDDARFGWSRLPWSVVAIGYVLFALSMALGVWAEAVNRFFEPSVRIQADRGQTVIDTGPYRFVRHPGYVSALLMFLAMPLSLGSLWALIPAALAALLLIVRTRWEDQMLHAELNGYREYAQRVRFRLLPGVW